MCYNKLDNEKTSYLLQMENNTGPNTDNFQSILHVYLFGK